MGGSLLIGGATVVDGSGGPARHADVAVEAGVITGVGTGLDAPPGARVVDGQGLVLAPGFIDLHTHCDFTLPAYPRAESMVRQGVTTIVTGNCGSTPYPVVTGRELLLREATAHLGSALDWDWSTTGEYAELLDDLPLALNVVMMVGHGSVRIGAMGFDQRVPTDSEMQAMRGLVDEAMAEGCAGLSSGLIYSPGSYATVDELADLASVAAGHGGFYATHMRNEGPALLDAVDEALEVSRRSGAALQISHHKVLGRRNWGLTARSLERIDAARRSGVDVLLDQYPYTATSTTLTALLPTWALEGGIEQMRARLGDERTRAAVRQEMLKGPTDGRPRRDFEPETVTVASVHSGRRPDVEGRNLAQVGAAAQAAPVDVFMDLLRDEGGGVEVVIAAIGEEDIRRVMRDPHVAIASDGWTLSPRAGGTPHPRSYGSFARVLGQYVREERVLGLEDAVRKMTSLPARRLGMADRGLIRPGARGDLVLFEAAAVIDTATYEQPHQFCAGVERVFVDGVAVVEDGGDSGAAAGRLLRRRGSQYAAS